MRFESLREILLTGGIAPRHVRRYLAELSEHLDDLTAEQRKLGYDGQDAALRARARLGGDAELAQAMLQQKSLRSVAARIPWAIFGLLPPFAAVAAMMLPVGMLVLTAKFFGFQMKGGAPPQWFGSLASITTASANLLIVPLVAVLFVTLAAHHRLSRLWPLLAIAILLILFVHSEAHLAVPGHPGNSLSVGLTPVFLPTTWKTIAAHWPTVIAQYALTVLPLAWQMRQHAVRQ